MIEGIDKWKEMDFTCKRCAWIGLGEELQHGEMFKECSELLCPRCEEVIRILAFPMASELLANSASLDPKTLESAQKLQAAHLSWKQQRLHRLDQLPGIDAKFIVLLWDQDWDNSVIRILFGDREIFRQPLDYEYADYFVHACRILKKKYGYRLLDVIPTPHAKTYLWGDCLGASGTTTEMRRLIGRDDQSEYPGYKSETVSRIQEWKTYRKEYDLK